MTWTVTDHGVQSNASLATTTSVVLTVTGTITAGDGIAVFTQYSDFMTDVLTIADNGGVTNTWVGPVNNFVEASSGQGQCDFYCLSCASGPTTITVSFGTGSTDVVQMVAAVGFKSSTAGVPTLHSHSGLDNTPATTTPNSGAAAATSGDLVLTGITSDGVLGLGATSLAITGVTSPAIINNANTAAGFADGSGTTTTTGNVTSTWTVSSHADVVLELIFSPPAGPTAVFSDSGSPGDLSLAARSGNERRRTIW